MVHTDASKSTKKTHSVVSEPKLSSSGVKRQSDPQYSPIFKPFFTFFDDDASIPLQAQQWL